MVKDRLLQNSGQRNVTRSGTSHVQTAQDIFHLLKDFYSSYFALKFGNILSIRN